MVLLRIEFFYRSREDLTNMSREILKAYKENKIGLAKSAYTAKDRTEKDYVIFGV